MKIIGLEKLSRQDIDARMRKLLTHYKSNYFDYPWPTDLRKICEFLERTHKIQFLFDSNLGFNEQGNRVLGLCNPVGKMILIDSSLSDPDTGNIAKFNFTLAHELGHLALHRKLTIERNEVSVTEGIQDTDVEISNENGRLVTDADWMEWQANCYAACLLMPEEFVRFKILEIKKREGIPINRAGLFLDDQRCNINDCRMIMNELAMYFGVSKSSVEYRLDALGLIERYGGFRTMKEIGKELLKMLQDKRNNRS